MWKEKNVLMHMRHPGIVKFEGLIETNKIFAIMMEMCCFGSLQDLLWRRVRLIEPEVRFCMLQIIDSLEYLHSKNVIHLANIFLQTWYDYQNWPDFFAKRIRRVINQQ
jgi:serine/threonine protein kinase